MECTFQGTMLLLLSIPITRSEVWSCVQSTVLSQNQSWYIEYKYKFAVVKHSQTL